MVVKKKQSRRRVFLGLLIVICAVGGYSYWSLSRPISFSNPRTGTVIYKSVWPSNIDWPDNIQAAVGISGSNILEDHLEQKAQPTASTAKLITTLVVLDKNPLKLGETGPIVTLTNRDVNIYRNYVKRQGSVVPVKADERITQYQMIQAMMLPSSNNMSDSLAIWAFGSLSAYKQAAQKYLASHGLYSIELGNDASGLDPKTISSARDLVRVGELAMQDPVLAEIVGQKTADDIPVAGTIKNYNVLLGHDGIVGVKTGSTDQAGGVFVGASKIKVNDKTVTIINSVVKARILAQAMRASHDLARSANKNFEQATVIKKGSVVGSYSLPWGGNVPVIAAQDLSLQIWKGSHVAAIVNLKPVSLTSKSGDHAGTATVPASAINNKMSVPVELASGPTQPSAWWRLTHPFN